MTFHDVRHTFGSRLFAAGWNVLAISRVLGHHSADFTLRTYVHALPDDTLPTIDVIDRGHQGDTVASDIARHADAAEAAESARLRALSA